MLQRLGVILPCFLDLIECRFNLLDNLPFELPAQLILIDYAISINFHLQVDLNMMKDRNAIKFAHELDSLL